MIAYFDTSAVVPLVVEEPASAQAGLVWEQAERTAATRLIYAEGRAALAMAHRTERITNREVRAAVNDLDRLYGEMDMIEISEAIVRRAGVLAETHKLRGYDAVHLASAETLADMEVVVVAGDRPLCEAATALGLAVSRLA